ncbi:lasso peptide biosynthesis B2 protein [Lujinxingia litoralis]|nr:lasso peptide biosynthesis B2 protein [Lujinxingia litoralis]
MTAWLHVEAVATVGIAYLGIEALGWDRARRIADRLAKDTGSTRAPDRDLGEYDLAIARKIERATLRASRLIPNARCAPRALAARHMLARRGLYARLQVGLRLQPRLEGHAWLELGSPTDPELLFVRADHTYQPIEALSGAAGPATARSVDPHLTSKGAFL